MPYIDPGKRAELDGPIDALAAKIVAAAKAEGGDAAFAGHLNYACTRLALSVIRQLFGRMHYWMIAAVCGVFKNVGDEFYRRVGGPYEDKKILKAGDVDLYKLYLSEIEKE